MNLELLTDGSYGVHRFVRWAKSFRFTFLSWFMSIDWHQNLKILMTK